MNAAQWQLGRESDNQMKLSHSCNMNLGVCRFVQSLRFTLLETDGDREWWLSCAHTHTDTHRLLFVYQAGTGQNTRPALICMDIWSVCGCGCVWMVLSVHKSVCVLWIQSSKFNIKSWFSVCIWCNAVVAVTVGLGWGIQFPLFKFNLCVAFW